MLIVSPGFHVFHKFYVSFFALDTIDGQLVTISSDGDNAGKPSKVGLKVSNGCVFIIVLVFWLFLLFCFGRE